MSWNEGSEEFPPTVSPHPTTQLCFLTSLLLPPLEDPFLEPAEEFMGYDSFSSCYYERLLAEIAITAENPLCIKHFIIFQENMGSREEFSHGKYNLD